MQLARALGIGPKEVVTLVGGGGKTTLMFRLAAELAAAGQRVVTSMTTRIYTNQPGPVYLYTGRPSYVLPDLVDAVTGLPREGYDKGVQSLQKNVLSGDAVLALFKFSSEGEDVQSVYMQLSNGLYLAHNAQGDKIYTAFP